MTGSRTSSLGSLFSSEPTSAQHAAFLGATRAFGRSTPASRTSPNSKKKSGALAAATSAHVTGGSNNPSSNGRSPGFPSSANGMSPVQSQEVRLPGRPELNAANLAVLNSPVVQSSNTGQRLADRFSSHQAAQLAAARSPQPYPGSESTRPRASTTRKPPVKPKPRRLSEHSRRSKERRQGGPDTSPIPPTTSLVNLFERKSGALGNGISARPGPIIVRPSQDMAIQSPKPVRSIDGGGITSVFKMELEEPLESSPVSTAQSEMPQLGVETLHHAQKTDDRPSSSGNEYASASESVPDSISPLVTSKHMERMPSAISMASNKTDEDKPLQMSRPPATKPLDIRPPSRPQTSSFEPKSASSQRSARSIQAQYHQMYPRRMTPLNTGDQLANAIVASSLASSRAPSPRKMELPPNPTRRHRHNILGFSRTPSPAKHGMLQTLRKPPDSSDESDSEDELHPYGKHKKKRLVRKHPNKHHEGDRKRWRDAVTERERKRYEGVWAANRGLHCAFAPDEERLFLQTAEGQAVIKSLPDRVSNMAAKEIWSRSRLPENILEMVWDLVDNDLIGRLSKDEFVISLWLIDQRLKGRKLPVKVSDTVWASVRSLQGIRIKK